MTITNLTTNTYLLGRGYVLQPSASNYVIADADLVNRQITDNVNGLLRAGLATVASVPSGWAAGPDTGLANPAYDVPQPVVVIT